MPVNIDVHGSCVSRSCFNRIDRSKIQVRQLFSRNNIVSCMMPAADIDFNHGELIKYDSEYAERCMKLALNKQTVPRLLESSSEYLAIDFFDFCQPVASYRDTTFSTYDYTFYNTAVYREKTDQFGMMISVLMLTYNREDLVSRAIESILAQTYRDFEFIIVDNGSADKSGQIADTYARRDSRIRVIHRERGNIGAGRNTGLDAAKGEYIAFIDDDDWAEPDFLEFLLNLLEETKADVAICGAADKVFDEKKIMTSEEAIIELMWRKKYNMGFPTKLFRRELMETLRFPEEGEYDDIALMYRLLARAKRAAYYGLPKYTVCRHESNNSAWTTNHKLLTPETLDEYLTAYRIRTEWLSGLFPQSAPVWRYFEWSFMISMVEKIIRLEIPRCGRQLAAMKEELSDHREEFLNAPEILEFEKRWMEKYV